MILIGTSGFSYQDWKGNFYPKNIKQQDMLAYYAQQFKTCEINATYYRIPSAANMETMVNKTKGEMTFVIKLHQNMTHLRNASNSEYRSYKEFLKPLQTVGKLGAVLAQFPYSFPNSLENRGYLADLKQKIAEEIELVVEFRHRSWEDESVLAFLKSLKIGIVNVDEPNIHGLLEASEKVSSPIGYIRFHGRNKEKWFAKEVQPWERYNYLYTEDELLSWVPRIKTIASQTRTTFIFFNNHWQSQAVTNAKQIIGLLG